jgi:hypothetical protein
MPVNPTSTPWAWRVAARPFRRKLLFVGAERPDEFAHARRLAIQGHAVTVANPRSTAAAWAYRSAGGRFIDVRVERLPRAMGGFHVICENYPYPFPVASSYETARTFAWARLSRLLRHGRWVVFTESPELVSALSAVARREPAVSCRFRVWFAELSPALAPPSSHVRRNSRYRLIFERLR